MMNFGLVVSFRNSSHHELSYSELYRSHLDLCVAAEELGFDTVWLTEHHFVDDGYPPDLMTLADYVAGRIQPDIDETFSLENIRAAHEKMEAGKAKGKIILTMGGTPDALAPE